MTDQLLALLAVGNEWSAVSWPVLVLAFAVTQVVLIPRFAMSLAAGALFGVTAIPLVAAGTTLGAVAAFLLARYVVARRAQRWVEGRSRLKQLLKAVDAEGWRLVAVSRCGVPIPASFVNYGFGLTNIRLWSFTWATFAFCIPQAALFVHLGAAGRSVLLAEPLSTENLLLMGFGVVASAAAVYLVTSRLRAMRRLPETALVSPGSPDV